MNPIYLSAGRAIEIYFLKKYPVNHPYKSFKGLVERMDNNGFASSDKAGRAIITEQNILDFIEWAAKPENQVRRTTTSKNASPVFNRPVGKADKPDYTLESMRHMVNLSRVATRYIETDGINKNSSETFRLIQLPSKPRASVSELLRPYGDWR